MCAHLVTNQCHDQGKGSMYVQKWLRYIEGALYIAVYKYRDEIIL